MPFEIHGVLWQLPELLEATGLKYDCFLNRYGDWEGIVNLPGSKTLYFTDELARQIIKDVELYGKNDSYSATEIARETGINYSSILKILDAGFPFYYSKKMRRIKREHGLYLIKAIMGIKESKDYFPVYIIPTMVKDLLLKMKTDGISEDDNNDPAINA